MNVIVSNNAIDYQGFIKVNKVEEVMSITGKIDCLIIHKSNESDDDVVKFLTELKDSVGKMIYIREFDSCNKAIQMIVVGSGGRYFDDEFFLESATELSNLVNNLEEVTEIAKLGGVNVIGDFFNRYLSNGSSNFNKEYLLVVKEAVANMIADYKAMDLELLQLSETATEIFANSANLISKIEEEKEKLQDIVLSLKESKDSIIPQTSSGPNILFFPQVSYLKEKNIIRVKEIGNFQFLTSLMIGMKLYLEKVKYTRPKLVFIYPVGEQYEDLYKEFPWVTQRNSSTMEGYYNSIVFTNFPNREVLNRLLDDTDYDIYIIVDRLKSSSSHVLNSRGPSIKYAVSSSSFVNRLGLKLLSCFLHKDVDGSLYTIRYDNNYPNEVEQRERYYLREYSDFYERLYNVRR